MKASYLGAMGYALRRGFRRLGLRRRFIMIRRCRRRVTRTGLRSASWRRTWDLIGLAFPSIIIRGGSLPGRLR